MWKLFSKKKTVESEPINNSISFVVEEGKPWVSLDILSLDDQSLRDFAEMLFAINNGRYQNTIVKILISLCEEKPELSPQFESILKYWLNIDDDYRKDLNKVKKTEHDPLISPRNTFLGTEK